MSGRYDKLFSEALEHDLNTSEALAVMWELVKDSGLSKEDKKATLVHFDTVLGLGLGKLGKPELPEEIQTLIQERDKARSEKDFTTSDSLRAKLESLGYDVLDTNEGTKVYKN